MISKTSYIDLKEKFESGMIDEDDYLFYRNSWFRKEAEDDVEYEKWLTKIPKVTLPKDWVLIPGTPFAGAVGYGKIFAEGMCFDLYLDCYNLLGYYYGDPYWQVYNGAEFSFRCDMKEPEKIIEAIQGELARCKSQK